MSIKVPRTCVSEQSGALRSVAGGASHRAASGTVRPGAASARASANTDRAPLYPECDKGTVTWGGELADRAAGPLRLLVESRRDQVLAIASRHRASRVRLFGSAARGEDRPDSDIDLLVDFDEDSSLFDLMRMTRELEALLGRAVDVVSAGGLKSRDRVILAESVDL